MAIGKILVLDADLISCKELCLLLGRQSYDAIAARSLEDLNRGLAEGGNLAVLMDLDSVAIDNRTIRDLALSNPGTPFLGMSKDRFHPELKDAICYHIYACLTKPIDTDELFYWLKCIREDEAAARLQG